MKTKMLSAIIICFSLLSCKKDDDSNLVKKGDNNNMVKNYSVTVHSFDWQWNSLYNQWQYNYYVAENANSAVYGYVMSGNGEEAMPYYSSIDFTTTSFAGNLFASSPYLKVEYYDGSTTLSPPSTDTYIYFVIVPPSQRLAHPEVNYNNLAAVKRTFGLK